MKSLSVSAMACQTLPRCKSLKRSVFKLDIHKASYNCDARDFTGRNGARQLALRDGACKKLLFPKWDVKLKHQLSRVLSKSCPLIRSESWTAQERKGKRFGTFLVSNVSAPSMSTFEFVPYVTAKPPRIIYFSDVSARGKQQCPRNL